MCRGVGGIQQTEVQQVEWSTLSTPLYNCSRKVADKLGGWVGGWVAGWVADKLGGWVAGWVAG